MDVLADVLRHARVSGALMAVLDAAAPWGIELPAGAGASFHAVVAGTCWFAVEDGEPRQLLPGDVVLLPTGSRHRLVSEPGRPVRPFDRALKAELVTPDGELRFPGAGPRTRVLCAGYDYDGDGAHLLLGVLPPVLQVASGSAGEPAQVRALLDLLAHEARGGAAPGAATAAVRLLDLLFIHLVRAWLAADAEQSASWLRGLRDSVSARALALLHERPGEPWTLQRLAVESHVSRATLVRRFTQEVGEPPLAYLTRWRMELAARRLRDTGLPASVIAREVGYTSEYAFNRAFTRLRGTPPGRYRRTG